MILIILNFYRYNNFYFVGRLLNYERISNRTFNNFDAMNGNSRFRDSIDELNQCDLPLNNVPDLNEYNHNQSLQYQPMITYGSTHNSRTSPPFSAASALNLEQLMQATGAQNMYFLLFNLFTLFF